jgi:hypothetical protein
MSARLSVLGLMSDLHEESIPYNLDVLRRTVLEIEPDLLCLEMTHQAWDQANFRDAALPVRETLAPAAATSSIVIIPVAARPQERSDYNQRSGARSRIANALDSLHRAVQRRSTIRTIHSRPYNAFCHTICELEEALWEPSAREAWKAENRAMLQQIIDAAQRDPGRRILTATQCHRKHWLDDRLAEHPGIELVDYWQL